MRDGKLKKKFLFSHEKRKIEKKGFSSQMKEEELRKISFLFTRNVRFCLFFIDKSSFFFHTKRKMEKNLFFFHMRNKKFKKKFLFSHEGRKIEKNIFSLHAKCGIPHPFTSLPGHPSNFDLLSFHKIVNFKNLID